ncbi:MAG TPA: energy transducer TonB [Thermoanaerobaculia bacterium]|jgi:hypothetical protein
MKILRCFLILSCLFCGLRGAGVQPARAAEVDPAAFEAIDGQLQRGEWEAARTAALEQIQKDRKTLFAPYLAGAVARLALAEAGLGREEDALWHWHIAQNLDRAVLSEGPLAAYGKAGELLARHPLRWRDEAPAGWTVFPARAVRPGRKLEGELPKLSADVGLVSAPKSLKVQAVIDAEGRLREPLVISGGVPGMIWEVLEGLRGWRYEPARQGDQAVAVFRELTVNPPAGRPLPELAALSGRAAAVEALLRQRKWRGAHKSARKLWIEELNHKQPARERLAAALTLRALAEAGAGETEAAICRWQAAQHLEERLYDADLSPYGIAGEILGRHRWGVARAERSSAEVREPEAAKRTSFPYPAPARRAGVRGVVVVAGVVDEQGALHQPVIVRLLSHAGIVEEAFETAASLTDLSGARSLPRLVAVSALNSLCDWRFQPATAGGRPVAYQELLAIPFDSGSPVFAGGSAPGLGSNSQGPHAHPGYGAPPGPRAAAVVNPPL